MAGSLMTLASGWLQGTGGSAAAAAAGRRAGSREQALISYCFLDTVS